MTPRQKSTTKRPRYASGANVIEFPQRQIGFEETVYRSEPATILILPVMRIEWRGVDMTISPERARKRQAWYAMKRVLLTDFDGC